MNRPGGEMQAMRTTIVDAEAKRAEGDVCKLERRQGGRFGRPLR
jgi:hypothetical protein